METTPEARWQLLSRVTGVAGLLTIVLVFVPIIAQSGEEPDFNGSAEEALTFIRSVDTALAELGRFSMTVGMVAFLWYVAGLATLLRRAEGEPSWRSTVALAFGVVVVPMVL